MGAFCSGFPVSQDMQFSEWDRSHYITCVSTERVPTWPHQGFYPLHHNLITNLAGSTHSDLAVQQDISLFLPDINTTPAPFSFSSQVNSFVLNSTLLGKHGDILPGFQFQAPSNHGRPNGSKTKKGPVKSSATVLESGPIKSASGGNEKKDCTTINVDPLEPAKSSGTGKKSKGDDEDETVVPVLQESTKYEAVVRGGCVSAPPA